MTASAVTNIAIVHGQLGQGGSERQLHFLLQHCDRKCWNPRLYLSGECGFWEEPIRALGIPIEVLQGNRLQKMWRLRRSCLRHHTDTFLSWGAYTNGYGLALTGLGIPRIGSFRNASLADLPERFRWLWMWMSLAGVSSIICNSEETLTSLRVMTRQHKRLAYVVNGVQALGQREQHRQHWRDRLGIGEQEMLVVGVGRLIEQKNFARFIEAIRLANTTSPMRAVIAGPDMGLKQQLQQQMSACNLPPGTIQLFDALPDARELICAADIFMLSSDYEGMPNVVLEAMALGIPCVCTRVNGIAALIEDGIHGLITDLRADALAGAITLLAKEPALRALLGGAAAARAQSEFSAECVAKRVWELCGECMITRPTPR